MCDTVTTTSGATINIFCNYFQHNRAWETRVIFHRFFSSRFTASSWALALSQLCYSIWKREHFRVNYVPHPPRPHSSSVLFMQKCDNDYKCLTSYIFCCSLILSLEAKLNLLHNYMNVTWIRIPSETRVCSFWTAKSLEQCVPTLMDRAVHITRGKFSGHNTKQKCHTKYICILRLWWPHLSWLQNVLTVWNLGSFGWTPSNCSIV